MQIYDTEGWVCWHRGSASTAAGAEQPFEETHGQLEGEEEAGPSTKRELLGRLSRRASSRLQSEVHHCDHHVGSNDTELVMAVEGMNVEGGDDDGRDEGLDRSDAEEEAVLNMVMG